jgi:hypothetical protein
MTATSGALSRLAKDAERVTPEHAEIALDHFPALFDGDLARLSSMLRGHQMASSVRSLKRAGMPQRRPQPS